MPWHKIDTDGREIFGKIGKWYGKVLRWAPSIKHRRRFSFCLLCIKLKLNFNSPFIFFASTSNFLFFRFHSLIFKGEFCCLLDSFSSLGWNGFSIWVAPKKNIVQFYILSTRVCMCVCVCKDGLPRRFMKISVSHAKKKREESKEKHTENLINLWVRL